MIRYYRDDREVRLTKADGGRAVTAEEIICDSTADIADLPGADEVAMGSIAYVVETGDMYMMNSTGEWIQQ